MSRSIKKRRLSTSSNHNEIPSEPKRKKSKIENISFEQKQKEFDAKCKNVTREYDQQITKLKKQIAKLESKKKSKIERLTKEHLAYMETKDIDSCDKCRTKMVNNIEHCNYCESEINLCKDCVSKCHFCDATICYDPFESNCDGVTDCCGPTGTRSDCEFDRVACVECAESGGYVNDNAEWYCEDCDDHIPTIDELRDIVDNC
eukprot:58382_1